VLVEHLVLDLGLFARRLVQPALVDQAAYLRFDLLVPLGLVTIVLV
jgi:hypothetical protein